MCTRQSRKVIWDMINTLFLTTVAVEPTFVAFLQHSKTHFHGLSCQFFQISLNNGELKPPTMPFGIVACFFFRQPFLKQLYTCIQRVIPSYTADFDILAFFILKLAGQWVDCGICRDAYRLSSSLHFSLACFFRSSTLTKSVSNERAEAVR